MPRYDVHYIKGSNYALKIGPSHLVEAVSFEAALALHTPWPVVETYDHSSACALNPGTCIYYMEAWEAVLLPEKSADHKLS